MRTLALDVGDKRIGIAVSGGGLLAAPLVVVRRASKREDFARIAGLIREVGAECLVVGLPLNADGSAGPQARAIERYTAALCEALRSDGIELPLVYWDEHLSSQRAQEAMIEAGRTARQRRERVDAVAAAIILGEYLEAQLHPGAGEAAGS